MIRPLSLPVGSVRALLLLCIGARCLIELYNGELLPMWTLVMALIAAAAYFSARAAKKDTADAGGGGGDRSTPLGLPAGTVRVLVLLFAIVGVWLWLRVQEEHPLKHAALWIVVGYGAGIAIRQVFATLRRPEDEGARFFDHMLAIVSLLAGVGLVASALAGHPEGTPEWSQPLLGAIATHYFGAR